jgi:O-antigen/teichoic acid export membrane protein
MFTLLPLVYWLILGFWGEELTRLAYDGIYGEYVTWLWLAGMIPLVAAAVNVMGAVLRALELPNKVLVAYGFSATTALTVGLPLIYVWGVVGALVGWLIAYLVTMVSLGVQLKRQLRHTPLANET